VNDPTKRIIASKNRTVPDTEIFNSDSIKFEIGGNATKTTINMNTADKYSCNIIIPKAITIKHQFKYPTDHSI
jgi:hypothetical protein